MDDLEPKSSPLSPGFSPAPRPTLEDLEREHVSLRQLLISSLLLMIVVSGTLNLFLLRQARYVRQDLANVKPQVSQMVAEYNKVSAPAISNFAFRLADFAKKNPDFMPVVVKYGLSSTGVPPAKATAPIPASAATSAPMPALKK